MAQQERTPKPDGPLRGRPQQIRPWASLAFRDYRLLWAAALLSTFGLQMRQFANAFQVYELSGSTLQLGLTGLFQALPLFAIGLFAGTVADAVDRRKLLMATMAVNIGLAMALGLLTATGAVHVWHIYVMTALTSTANIFQQPARTALISGVVPRSHLLNAITLNQVINQVGRLSGPFAGGFIVAAAGAEFAYFINAALFVPALMAMIAMRAGAVGEAGRERISGKALLEGLQFIWGMRIVVAFIMLDVFATVFGGFQPLMPVFAKDILGVGPAGLGILMAAPAIGALVGATGLLLLGNVERKGLLMLVSVLLFAGMLAVFGLSKWFFLSVAAGAALGMLDAMSVSVRQTSVQLLTPERLRGRTTSINQVFAMGAPSIGYIVAGGMAAALGAPAAMVIGAVVCGAVVVLVGVFWRQVREYRT
ncbi:MAG: MFS transporter [Dehalococcoidia bacterium]|nr:MFS transporter [Dehalococcoidia bacterium]